MEMFENKELRVLVFISFSKVPAGVKCCVFALEVVYLEGWLLSSVLSCYMPLPVLVGDLRCFFCLSAELFARQPVFLSAAGAYVCKLF